jgi:hypothetical protein
MQLKGKGKGAESENDLASESKLTTVTLHIVPVKLLDVASAK